MGLFIVTFFVMALAVFGMAIGVVFGRAPIAGSCGGLNAVDGSGRCLSCSRPCRSARRAGANRAIENDSRLPGDAHALQDLRESGNN